MKVKHKKWKCLILVLLVCVLFGVLRYYFSLSSPKDYKKINQVFQELVRKYHIPGAVLSYSFGSNHLITFAAGYSSLLPKEKMSEENIFFVGSTTKSFTAAIILELTEDNKITLDETLGAFSKTYTGKISYLVKKYPDLSSMTMRELLDHTSGVPESINTQVYKNKFIKNPKEYYSDLSLIELAMQTAVYFKPGAPGKWSYTDTDYILLGLVIQDVTHEPLEESFQKLFEQAHLKNIYFASPNSLVPPNWRAVAPGYMSTDSTNMLVKAFTREPKANIPGDPDGPSFYQLKNAYSLFSGAASGGVITGAPALADWYRSLFEKRTILTPHSLQEMLKSVPNGKYNSAGYGLGVTTHIYPGVGFVVSHDGLEPGYSSIVMFFPKYQLVLAITSNSLNSNVSTFNVHDGSIMLGLVSDLLPVLLRGHSAS